MQFEVLISIVSEELEEKAIECAKNAGAGGVTVIKGKALGLKEKKIFFGLTLEENVSLLLTILPKKITMAIIKALNEELNDKETKEQKAITFTMPISHLSGIDIEEIELFEDEVKEFL